MTRFHGDAHPKQAHLNSARGERAVIDVEDLPRIVKVADAAVGELLRPALRSHVGLNPRRRLARRDMRV